MEKNLALVAGVGKLNHFVLSCCGTLICKKCNGLMDEENEKTGREFLCPICRSPLAKGYEEEFSRI